jgi:dUTP pyrophosphatase
MKVAKTVPHATLPTRKFPQDAGLDFYSSENITIPPGEYRIVNTGISIKLPFGYDGFLWPKSKANFLIGGGVIDNNYQGEIRVKIFNPDKKDLVILVGDPIAQLVLAMTFKESVKEVSLSDLHTEKTDRGTTGGIVTQKAYINIVGDNEVLIWEDGNAEKTEISTTTSNG